MQPIKILIVEDEFIIARNLQVILEDLGYEPYEPVGNKKDALAFLQNEEIDLVILDINLEGKKEGIEIGKYIHEVKQIPFIYLTSNSDKATINEAKLTHPRSYLIKPFNEPDIYAAIEMAVEPESTGKEEISADINWNVSALQNSLFVKLGSKYIKVKIDEITYVEADGKTVEIHTLQGQKFQVKMSLEQMQNQLAKHGFVRVQRSFIINLQHLSAINGEAVYIEQLAIPIGRQYKEELMKQIKAIN
ncbi:MAG: response regulator [Bacteroidia bacterium]|nr:response regulator [Bacteroidia bacterium]MCF8425806.1 response regulator [Bacteroidia bacterium]MCF8447837.1 response regulator [Bacteroidia bacterium]